MLRISNDDLINNLLSKPESGIGYQIFEIPFGILFLNDSSTQNVVVFNAELLVQLHNVNGKLLVPSLELEEINKYDSYEALIKNANIMTQSEVNYFIKGLEYPSSNNPHNPANLPIQDTDDNEGFIRFSAYINDRRRTMEGGLHKGTYATTVNDIKIVPSGLSAVSRYALPNPFPAIYVFTIIPPKETPIHCGTVQPAFNQSGGGVEVIFTDGTPPGTVSEPYLIPSK